MVAGPGWKGEPPKGIDKVFHSETELALAIYRTQLFKVTEPRAKVIDAKREGLKNIRYEPQRRFSFTKQLGYIFWQLVPFSNRVPTDFTIITHDLTLRPGRTSAKPVSFGLRDCGVLLVV